MADKFPGVKSARRIAREHNAAAVMVLTLARDGQYQIATYGKDKATCGEMAETNVQIDELIQGGYIGLPARRCRVCGCTDERACPEGCKWVDDDLCSRCMGGAR